MGENWIFFRTIFLTLILCTIIEAYYPSRDFNWTFDDVQNSTLLRYLYRRSALSPSAHSGGVRKTKKCSNDSEIVSVILGPRYNANKIPGGSTTVEVEVWVQEITTISDITSDFQLDIYISELWLDPELRYDHMEPCKHNLSLTYKSLDKIWTPNSCFINSKEADIHESPFRFVSPVDVRDEKIIIF